MAEKNENTPPPEWTADFDDTVKGYVQNKGFKNAKDLANSYMNLEKLQGAGPEKLLKLPDSMDSDEAKPIWEKLGKPKEAKEYGLDPKVYGEHLAQEFYDSNLTKSQVDKLLAKQTERQKAQADQAAIAKKLAQSQADTALKTEWGMAYEDNRAIVDRTTKHLGITAEQVQALGEQLGPDKAMKMLLELGQKTGEHTFEQGNPAPSGGKLDPASARQKIAELRQDAGWVKKYLSKDYDALKAMQNLQEMAYPGTTQL